MKACRTCRFEKPFLEFYSDHGKPGKYRPDCISCVKTDEKNRVSVLRNDTKWLARERARCRKKNIFRHQTGKICRVARPILTKRQKSLRKRHPERYRANRRVYIAIKNGILIRPKVCSRCDVTCKPNAHHADYSKPLEVIWVCRRCHGVFHQKKL